MSRLPVGHVSAGQPDSGAEAIAEVAHGGLADQRWDVVNYPLYSGNTVRM